jgi:hypothetical protein
MPRRCRRESPDGRSSSGCGVPPHSGSVSRDLISDRLRARSGREFRRQSLRWTSIRTARALHSKSLSGHDGFHRGPRRVDSARLSGGIGQG